MKITVHHLLWIMLSLTVLNSPSMAQEAELSRMIGLGDLLYADQSDAFERLNTFYPDLRQVPTEPLPDGMFGDAYFDFFMANATGKGLNQLKCRRFGRDTQEAIIQGNHPLFPIFLDNRSGEEQDVGKYDVIMDCHFYMKPNTLGVPELVNYLVLTGYDVDIRMTPELNGGRASDSAPYELDFESSTQNWTGPNIIRGDFFVNDVVQILWLRFGYLPELLS